MYYRWVYNVSYLLCIFLNVGTIFGLVPTICNYLLTHFGKDCMDFYFVNDPSSCDFPPSSEYIGQSFVS